MKIATNMLKRFVGEITNEKLYDLTNRYLTEVESLTPLVDSGELVVGFVKESVKHPNSDHLSVCQVDVKTAVKQIVCGASNVKAGQYVIVALEGVTLPGDFLIKKATIRGVESNGMICSLEELGFEDKNIPEQFKGGIYYFDQKQEIGSNALKALNLDQASLEISITPNRTDLLSVLGFSYDLGAVLNKKIKYPEPEVFEAKIENPLKITILDQGCKRYYARYLDNIKIGPSPAWLKADLIASGIRPINNIVDITNYVLLELGTPLHAFDAKKFGGDEIVVKSAQDLSEVITLDEERRILRKEDITITNGKEVKAIGGVMGLLNSAIDEKTTSIILEAAWFDGKRIKATSERLNLVSDASYRFEKGVDELRVLTALNRAAELMVELTGARVYKNVAFSGQAFERPTLIKLESEKVNRLLGINLSEEEIKAILKRLNIIETKPQLFLIPSYRKDLLIEVDLIEEVGRLYGYDKLPTALPSIINIGKRSKQQTLLKEIRNHFVHLGLNEVINYSLMKTTEVHLFKALKKATISVLQPLSEDKKTLRQSLINGLVNNVKYHQARQMEKASFFEIGRTYYQDGEVNNLAVIITGNFISGHYLPTEVKSDFFVLKGLLTTLADYLELTFSYQKTTNIAGLHPGVTATILLDGEEIGVIGEIHPNVLKDSYVFEIDLDKIAAKIALKTDYQPISKFPSITRDVSLVISNDVSHQEIAALIEQTARKDLIELFLFDRYSADKFGENMQSLAYRLVFNSKAKTLVKEDIDKIMRSIHIRLERELKAQVRTKEG